MEYAGYVLVYVVLGFVLSINMWNWWIEDYIDYKRWESVQTYNDKLVYKFNKPYRVFIKLCTTVLWPIMFIVTLVRLFVTLVHWMFKD